MHLGQVADWFVLAARVTCRLQRGNALLVFFICKFILPICHGSIQAFLYRNMGHRMRRHSAVPMLFARVYPNCIAGHYLLRGLATQLNQPKA